MNATCFGARGIALALLAGGLLVSTACERTVLRDDLGRPAARDADLVAGDPAACIGTDAHDRHAAARVTCVSCHPCGGTLGFSTVEYPGGTTSEGGTFVIDDEGTGTTCNVGCHAPKAPAGTAPPTIAWNTPGPLACTSCHQLAWLPPTHPALSSPTPPREECEECHDMAEHSQGQVVFVGHPAEWIQPTSDGFHAYDANQNLARCQGCHAQDLSGGFTLVSCASCHDGDGPGQATTTWGSCTMCHGGDVNLTGAPPKATWGKGGDAIRIGAHTQHVGGSAIAPAFDCDVCHNPKPASVTTSGHIDGEFAEIAFSPFANRSDPPAAWDRSSATCSSTYCHGAEMLGGTHTAPIWTRVGQGEATCGSCHGLPPGGTHPTVTGGRTACNVCHGDTVNAAGDIIPPSAGGLHLDGIVEAEGHEPEWSDPTNPEFHAFSANRGLTSCTACHGEDLSGGTTGIGCASCHDGAGPGLAASLWPSCTMCHGGDTDLTGAPPKATWGNAGDPLRVGAHGRHIGGGSIGPAFACEECHVTPADPFAPGHIGGGVATLTWGVRATTGGAEPVWDRAAGTCATTYCHGNYQGIFTYFFWDEYKSAAYAGGSGTPEWLGDPMTCTSCHGNPPSQNLAWHGYHGGGNECELCHPDAVGVPSGTSNHITNTALHVNGVVDLAPRWRSRCLNCH